MKKFRVILLTAVLAVAMMAGSLSVFAADEVEPGTGGTTTETSVTSANKDGTVTVTKTVNRPIKNANTLIRADDNPRTIARAAPTEAPVLTPSKSGDTSLFLNVS